MTKLSLSILALAACVLLSGCDTTGQVNPDGTWTLTGLLPKKKEPVPPPPVLLPAPPAPLQSANPQLAK